MSKEELEEVIEYEDEYYEENFIEEQEELSDNDQVEQDSKGQVKFKSVNHHKRAEANEVESDGETATYANYALEYFGYRCALSGEKFVAFDNAVEREGNAKLTTNLSAEHIVALTTGGNDIIPNIVPTVLQYNLQKNGYYILDWWPKARNIEGKPIYNEERLLKLVNYMLKSLQIRKELGIKERPREYKKRLLKPNAIDEYLAQGEIASGLISDVITATEDDIDGKKILTKIPESEGSIPSLSEQKENEIKITEEMFLVDAIDVLEREKDIPQEIIESLKELYKEVEGEIPFEVEVRRNILSVLKEMGIEENKYIVANTLLINTNLLEKARENKEAIQNIIKEYLKKQIEELREVLTEDQIKIAISNMPNVLFEETTRNRIKFWKDTRGENFEEILQRGGENSADSFIDNIIKLQMLGVDTNKLVQGDTIESLAKKSGIPTERLEEAGLNPKDNIGNKKNKIAVYYKKEQKGEKPKGTPPTQEQVEELLKLGISLESINSTEEFISQIKILQELGVDTNKLVQGDTIESLAKKSGIPTERLEEAGLNPKYNIGSKKNKIAGNYRQEQKGEALKGPPPTQEQVEELLKLGISLESINSTEEFISQIKILQKLGVDTNKLVQRDTIESLAKKSGIPIEKLEEAGLNPKDNIGIKKNEIAIKYRQEQKGEKPKGTPPTQEQVEELLKLGISLESINSTEEFISQIKILQELGVDTNKLVKGDTIESLAKKSGIPTERLEEVGLNSKDNIGIKKNEIAIKYRKKQKGEEPNGTPPTQEQVEELLKLGISLESINSTEEFINQIKILQELGVDTNKLVRRDTIESLAKKSGIPTERLEEAGLNPKYNIGSKKNEIAVYYKKEQKGEKPKGTPPTQEQVEELLKLGISLDFQELANPTEEFISQIKILQELEVDTNKLVQRDTIESLAKKSGIPTERLEEAGLNPKDNIGIKKNEIAIKYRQEQKGEKPKGTPPTQEQVEELLKLGISLESINSTEEFISQIKILQELGVDTNKLVKGDTIESLAKKSGIPTERLEEAGLNPKDNIGIKKNEIAIKYRKKQKGEKPKGRPPTDEQVKELSELGISLEGNSKKKIKDTVQQNKNNLSEVMQVGKRLEVEILMAEKVAERSTSDGRGQ